MGGGVGGVLGRLGGRFPQIIDPLALCTNLSNPFLVTDPKNFKRGFRRQYILILREERAPKKTVFFWSKFS